MTNNYEQSRKTASGNEEGTTETKAKIDAQAFTAAELWNIQKALRPRVTRRFL